MTDPMTQRDELLALADELMAQNYGHVCDIENMASHFALLANAATALRLAASRSSGAVREAYPSQEAMKAAVELEIHAALGSVQTVVIGRLIQQAIDAALNALVPVDGVRELRAALKEIVARTYSSDRRCRLDYEPIAEICDIAKAALAQTEGGKIQPAPADDAAVAWENTMERRLSYIEPATRHRRPLYTHPAKAVDVEAVKHLIGAARAFLRYFNPCNLAEDKSQQWQSLSHECDVVERTLLLTGNASSETEGGR